MRGSSQSAPKPGEANGAGARTGSRLCAPSGEGLGAAASLKSAAVPLCQEGGPLPGRLWVSREEKVGRAELRAGERALNSPITGQKWSGCPPAAVSGPKCVVPGCHHGPGPPLLGASGYHSRTGFLSKRKKKFFSFFFLSL